MAGSDSSGGGGGGIDAQTRRISHMLSLPLLVAGRRPFLSVFALVPIVAFYFVLAISLFAAQPPKSLSDIADLTRSFFAASPAAERRLSQAKRNPPELRAFLQRMPKGADLHSHLSGAVYAETYIRIAEERRLCFDTDPSVLKIMRCDAASLQLGAGIPARESSTDRSDEIPAFPCPGYLYREGMRVPHGCPVPTRIMVSALDDAGRLQLMAAISMRGDDPSHIRDGHARFFGTFARIGEASSPRDPAELVPNQAVMVTDVVRRAAGQKIHHLELMVSFGGNDFWSFASQFAKTDDYGAIHAKAGNDAVTAMVRTAAKNIADLEAARYRLMQCRPTSEGQGAGSAAALIPEPGCDVSVRYIGQINRNNPPGVTFAYGMLYALLAQQSPSVVGLTLVNPEDYQAALEHYSGQMKAIGHLKTLYPAMKVSLHAGELTLGLVPPGDLRFHIGQAVRIAGADRIGHGVSLGYEPDREALLRHMAGRGVAVEINLTSNDTILGIRDAEHPFRRYRDAGVPLVISTDDEGISRIDLTHELERAVRSYDLTYADLVELARNSLEYSFLPGASLWQDMRAGLPVAACPRSTLESTDTMERLPAECRAFLSDSTKAERQWRLEFALGKFQASL